MKIYEILREGQDFTSLVSRLRSIYTLQNDMRAPDGERDAAEIAYQRIIERIASDFGEEQAKYADNLVRDVGKVSTPLPNFSGDEDFWSYIKAEMDRMGEARKMERYGPFGRAGFDEGQEDFIKRIKPKKGETVEIQFQFSDGSAVPNKWVLAKLISVSPNSITLDHNGIVASFHLDGDCFGRESNMKLWAILIMLEHDGEMVFENSQEEIFWNSYFGENSSGGMITSK